MLRTLDGFAYASAFSLRIENNRQGEKTMDDDKQQKPQKYRVYGETTISYTIDLSANSHDEAQAKAACIDLDKWDESNPSFFIYEIEPL